MRKGLDKVGIVKSRSVTTKVVGEVVTVIAGWYSKFALFMSFRVRVEYCFMISHLEAASGERVKHEVGGTDEYGLSLDRDVDVEIGSRAIIYLSSSIVQCWIKVGEKLSSVFGCIQRDARRDKNSAFKAVRNRIESFL